MNRMADRVIGEVKRAATALKNYLATPSGRRAQWVLTAVFVGASLVIAGQSLDDIDGFALWGYAYVVLFLIPSGFSVMAVQYAVAARLLGVPPGADESLRVASAATTANLLPVPGAVLVRVAALRQRGVSVTVASAMTASVAFAVLSMSLLVSSVCLIAASGAIAGACLVLGLISAGTSLRLIPKAVAQRRMAFATLLAVGGYVALVNGVNLYAVLSALGQDVSLPASVAIAASGVVASAAVIIPAGLGLRELIAGVLSLTLGFDAGAAVTAVLITRFAEILGLVALQVRYRPSRRRQV